MIPVFGKPLIEFAFDHLIDAGFEKFIINTHHEAKAYKEYFKTEKEWIDALNISKLDAFHLEFHENPLQGIANLQQAEMLYVILGDFLLQKVGKPFERIQNFMTEHFH